MPDELTTDDARQSLVDDLVTGVRRSGHADTYVEAEDPLKRKKVLDELVADDAATKAHRGLRFTKLRPPGCG